jgi:hypothetical protein
MNFLKKLFGGKPNETIQNTNKVLKDSSERAGIMSEEVLQGVTYKNVDMSNMTDGALKVMEMLSKSLLDIEDEDLPIYHPVNLDEYFYVWGTCMDFKDIEGIASQTENATFMALAFGKYLNKEYGFVWKEKIENGQKYLILWNDNPKSEMYPINSILNAMKERRYSLFTEINEKFIELSKSIE